ncbi:peroxidase [Nemania serpens]|nr:peroxidase [Nemania serpens]
MMKISAIFLACAATRALAYPGMHRILSEIQAHAGLVFGARSTPLPRDSSSDTLTAEGQDIKDIPQLAGDPIDHSSASYKPPGPLGSPACSKDPLCLWYYIAQEMWADFTDASGCTELARGAIRLGFHDAAAWDVTSPYGGADGSILLTDEILRPVNRGLEQIAARTREYYNKYHPYGAGMADIIQLGAIVGTVACPGGPRIRAFAGRIDDPRPAPPNKLPEPSMDAPAIIELFARKTFSASDVIALIGSHTSARQFFVDPRRAGAPLDSDPSIWDTLYYREVLTGNNKTIFILHSDMSLATYKETRPEWEAFAGPKGQALWNPVSF